MKKRKKDQLIDKNISQPNGNYLVKIIFSRDGHYYEGKGHGYSEGVAYGRAKVRGVWVSDWQI